MNYTHLNENNMYDIPLDDYARFTWDGVDMWEEYHAFIINQKGGSLKFYNGPSYSNNYIKAQFQSSNTQLLGVQFNTWQINFTICVYGATEREYRKLIYHLSPNKISELSFGYESQYHYLVKVSKVDDGVRYFLRTNAMNEALYYTELNISFEIQGAACARSRVFKQSLTDFNNQNTTNYHSDLKTPFKIQFDISNEHSGVSITGEAEQNNFITTLFNLSFAHLDTIEETQTFEYDSESGNLFLLNGQREIVSLLTTATNGMRVVQQMDIHKQFLPGLFDVQIDTIKIDLKLSYVDDTGEVQVEPLPGTIIYQNRTNLI